MIAHTPDGAALHVEVVGSGEPMLLLAGQAVSRRSWDPLVPRLAREFTVITTDARGIEASTAGSLDEWPTSLLAGDAATVLAAAGFDRAHVVGHSMGGRVAQELAIGWPEAVASLALIATTAGDVPGHRRSRAATEALASADPERLAAYFFSPAHRAEHPDAIDLFLKRDASLAARRKHFVASSTHDAWDRLGSIAAPTLVVHGGADEVTLPASGRALAAGIPGAEYLEIEGGAHAVQLEGSTVVEAVAAFARSHPLSPCPPRVNGEGAHINPR